MTTTILVFKTDITNPRKVMSVLPILSNYPIITDWSIDTEDVDHVLRIEAYGDLKESEIIRLMKQYGFYCEVLTD